MSDVSDPNWPYLSFDPSPMLFEDGDFARYRPKAA